MNLQDLIDFHIIGAEACEAYAATPDADAEKNKDVAKHYNKRAKWHRDAIALVQGLSACRAALREELDRVCGDEWRKDKRQIIDLQQRLTVAEQRAGEFEGLLHMSKELLTTISRHGATTKPVDWCDSFKAEVADRIEKIGAALKPAAQHQGEPVAICRLWNEGGSGERTSVEFIGEPCADGTLLYAEQSAPVAVVMPERIEPRDPHDSEANQWNACIDEFARLNGLKP